MKTNQKLLTFCIFIIVLLSSSTTSMGSDNDDTIIELNDILENLNLHNLTVDKENRKVEINSVREDEFGKIFLKFKFRAENTLFIELTSGKNIDNFTQRHTLKLDLIGIMEYLDDNSNDQFDSKNDTVVSLYPLSNNIYFNDFLKEIHTVNGQNILNITNEQIEYEILEKYYEGYDAGYENAYALGLKEGQYDRENNLTYFKFYTYHITTKQINEILTPLRENLKQEIESLSEQLPFSTFEIIDLFNKGFYNGFSKGFSAGYDESYKNTESEKQGKVETRSFYNYWSDYDLSIFERPVYWLPRYKPITVDKIEIEKNIQEIKISIFDLREIFELQCIIANHFIKVENGYLAPSSVKFNININDFPYANENTKLALLGQLIVSSTSTIDYTINSLSNSYDEALGFAENEEELRLNSNNFTGYFSWVKYAVSDGELKDIKMSELSYYTSTMDYTNSGTGRSYYSNFFHIILSYPRGEKISHDPKMGVTRIDNYDLYLGEISDITDKVSDIWNNWAFLLSTIFTVTFILISKKIRQIYY